MILAPCMRSHISGPELMTDISQVYEVDKGATKITLTVGTVDIMQLF